MVIYQMRWLGLSHLIILSVDYPNNLAKILMIQTAGNTCCTDDVESPPKKDEYPSQEHVMTRALRQSGVPSTQGSVLDEANQQPYIPQL